MRYSATVGRLENEGSRAWDIHYRAGDYLGEGRDVVILSIGDPDFQTPEGITRAMVESLNRGDTHYGTVDGAPELKCAIAAWYSRHSGREVSAENVTVTPGAQGALFGAVMCLAQAGDEVVVPQPVYVTYDSVVQASGATLVSIPLRPERRFHLDPGDVAAAITGRTRVIMINTPHNPTGAAYRLEDLEALAELCIAQRSLARVRRSLQPDAVRRPQACFPFVPSRHGRENHRGRQPFQVPRHDRVACRLDGGPGRVCPAHVQPFTGDPLWLADLHPVRRRRGVHTAAFPRSRR